MAQYKAMAPGVEVNGQTVLSVVDAMSVKRRGLQILAENGIEDPKPDEWYQQQSWLDAFRTIGDEMIPSSEDLNCSEYPQSVLTETIESGMGTSPISNSFAESRTVEPTEYGPPLVMTSILEDVMTSASAGSDMDGRNSLPFILFCCVTA